MKEPQKTARVEKLRDYYFNNSKMATDKKYGVLEVSQFANVIC